MRSAVPAGSYRSALRSREFDGILGAFLIDVLGDSAAYLAVTVLVYQRTHSPLLASLTFAVAFTPYLVGGTLLSGLVDRLRPKVLLVGFDLTATALVAVMVIPHAPIALLFGVLVTIGLIAPVRSGASNALVADILARDDFVAGRSALRVCSQLAQLVGIGLGGGLVAAVGARAALAGDAASFLVSATILALSVRDRPARAVATGSVVADSLRGLRAVWADRGVRRLLLVSWLLVMASVAPEGLAAPSVAELGAGPGAVGLWLGAIPVGVIAGDLLTVWFVPVRRRAGMLVPLALALCLLLVGFLAKLPLPLTLVLLVGVGLSSAYGLGMDQRLRDTAPPALLSRALTVSGTGMMALQGLGFAVAGALAEAIGPFPAVATVGGLTLAILLTLLPGLLRARPDMTKPPAPQGVPLSAVGSSLGQSSQGP